MKGVRGLRIGELIALAAIALVLPACVRRESPTSQASSTESVKLETVEPASGGKLVLIPGGEFVMGDRHGEEDEPLHQVRVDSFYMDCYLVTQESYEAIMKKNPSKWKAPKNPVEQLQWIDAVQFCNRCSELEGLQPCYDLATWECDFDANGYRLPTEAEWEYACRAGAQTRFSFGDNAADIGQYGWCKPQSRGRPHPVGAKHPNRWGLYDMHGNVWQWCNDYYDAVFYTSNERGDSHGPRQGEKRVLRGGSWKLPAEECRSANREKEFPVFTDACFGADSYGCRRVRRADRNGALPKPPSQSPPIAAADVAKVKSESSNSKMRAGASEDDGPSFKSPSSETTLPETPSPIDSARLQGSIVFVSDRGGPLDIWIMQADGSHGKQLTSDSHADADPRFSPDGQQILYTSSRNGFPEIWMMHRDGSAANRLTQGSQADWSPDGLSIAFIRDDRVIVRQLDSGIERTITPADWNRCGVPAWRPDGTQIALASRHQGTIGIFLVDPLGKDPNQLAASDPCCTPCWSPGGERIVYQTDKGHIHELNFDSDQEEQLTFGADIQRDARYSPDGAMLAFCRAPSEEGPWQICVLDLKSEDLDWVQITHEGSNQLPDWAIALGQDT